MIKVIFKILACCSILFFAPQTLLSKNHDSIALNKNNQNILASSEEFVGSFRYW